MSQKPETIAQQVESAQAPGKGLPPLETWNPELSGDIDIVIARDGQWLYQGKPLSLKLFLWMFH